MTTATATTSPTIAAAVNLGELTVAPNTITEGQAAWSRIKTASKMLREDWCKVGIALIVGRTQFTTAKGGLYKKGFGQWCVAHGFGDIDRSARLDAMWLAEKFSNGGEFPISLNHPTAIRIAYNESLNPLPGGEEDEENAAPTKTLPASSNQAPQAQDKKDSGSKGTTIPPVSPPPADEDESEDDDAPFDLGPAVFTDTSTATTSDPKTSSIDGTEEGDEMARRKRGRLYAVDVAEDPETKERLNLTILQTQIVGGADFTGTTVKHFLETYMKEFSAVGVFNTMQSDMTSNLHNGADLTDARNGAEANMEAFRKRMLDHVNKMCDEGITLFKERTVNMYKAEKFVGMVFRPTTPVNEAVTAAEMAIKAMER